MNIKLLIKQFTFPLSLILLCYINLQYMHYSILIDKYSLTPFSYLENIIHAFIDICLLFFIPLYLIGKKTYLFFIPYTIITILVIVNVSYSRFFYTYMPPILYGEFNNLDGLSANVFATIRFSDITILITTLASILSYKQFHRAYSEIRRKTRRIFSLYILGIAFILLGGLIATATIHWSSLNYKYVHPFKNSPTESIFNDVIISNIRSRVSDIFVRARLKNETLTKESFFRQYNNPSDFGTFFDFARVYLKQISKTISFGTWKHHVSIIKKLETFAPGLVFSEITHEFLLSFFAYLRKIGNMDSTAWRNMATIKIYVGAAIRGGYMDQDPFAAIKIRRPKSEVIYLTEEELLRLTALYRSGRLEECTQNVLRFFLFLCFTSLHIGDAKALQINQFIGNELHYTRGKTKIPVTVPLSDPARYIYEYYRAGRTKGNLFMNLPTDQDINRVLKTIAGKVGITKDISSKTGRHTFATLYYKKTHDIVTLSHLLGHSSITMTMVYAHALEDEREAGIHAFDDML